MFVNYKCKRRKSEVNVAQCDLIFWRNFVLLNSKQRQACGVILTVCTSSLQGIVGPRGLPGAAGQSGSQVGHVSLSVVRVRACVCACVRAYNH